MKLGQKLNEGKTKQIFELPDEPGHVLVQSKDQITAGNAVRKDQMEGKAAIANKTTSCVFKLLQEAGEMVVMTEFGRRNKKFYTPTQTALIRQANSDSVVSCV